MKIYNTKKWKNLENQYKKYIKQLDNLAKNWDDDKEDELWNTAIKINKKLSKVENKQIEILLKKVNSAS